MTTLSRSLVVPDPECEGVTPDQVAAESTPEWDATVAELGEPDLSCDASCGPDCTQHDGVDRESLAEMRDAAMGNEARAMDAEVEMAEGVAS